MKSVQGAIKNLKRFCPVCSSQKGRIVHTQNFLFEKHNPLPSSYDLVICSKCSFVFADVAASQKNYDDFYALSSKYENGEIASGSGLSSWDYNRLAGTVSEITKHCTNLQSRILDIGSAQGGLLKILSENGFSELFALEPSDDCVQAINSSSSKSIKAHIGTIHSNFDNIFGQAKFDVIILSHVLEHLYDLSTAIENIKSILSDDGILYIEVPDAAEYANLFKTSFHYFDAEHINHFNDTTLNTLFGINGFETISTGKKRALVSDSELYPAVFSIFRKNRIAEYILNYINISYSNDNHELFDKLKIDKIPLAIWGCGSYTKRLLASTELKNCNIQYLVDTDSKKQGAIIGSLEISSPEALSNFEGHILISSAIYSASIENDIRERKFKNKIITLR